MESMRKNLKNYLIFSSYCSVCAYLLLNPVVANHDKVLSFGILNLALLLFGSIKETISREDLARREEQARRGAMQTGNKV